MVGVTWRKERDLMKREPADELSRGDPRKKVISNE